MKKLTSLVIAMSLFAALSVTAFAAAEKEGCRCAPCTCAPCQCK